MEYLMLSFIGFLTEAADGMVGTIGSDGKGKRHTKNYVMDYLSAEGRKKTAQSFAQHGGMGDVGTGNGSLHTGEATHILKTAQNGHPAGTKVKITHATADDKGAITIHTQDHGSFSQAALMKPKELQKSSRTQSGFDVEGKIASNLGTEAAGSTKHGYDYQYSSGRGHVRGKVKEVGAAPDIRGESKLDKGKMGQSVFKHDPEKGWHFTNSPIGNHFEKARIKGSDGVERGLIDHFNHFHSNGKIDKSYSIDVPKGATRNYLNTSNVNSLHLHNKATNKGTTFTIGDTDLKGRTKLGHLSDEHLDALDGKLVIEKTSTGSTQAIHRPKATVMKQYANLSTTDSANHRDLTNEDHAKEFRTHVDAMSNAGGTSAPAAAKPARNKKPSLAEAIFNVVRQ